MFLNAGPLSHVLHKACGFYCEILHSIIFRNAYPCCVIAELFPKLLPKVRGMGIENDYIGLFKAALLKKELH